MKTYSLGWGVTVISSNPFISGSLMCHDFHFPRQFQAELIADKFEDQGDSADKVAQFVTAPRHTGKSAFLKRDLVPLLNRRGFHTIYCDLWNAPSCDPGKNIVDVLIAELVAVAKQRGIGLDTLPISKVGVGSYTCLLPATNARRKGTLSTIIGEIIARTECPLVLIVDEAQEAWESPTGQAALTALRQARLEFGSSGTGSKLHLLFAGSHRDKLSALVLKRSAPFFGAQVQEFPRLGRDYIESLVSVVNPRLAPANQLDADDVEAAFELLGYQPKTLTHVVMEHALSASGSEGLKQTVQTAPNSLRARIWRQHEDDFGTLNPMQRSVLRVLIEDGASFSPFAARTLERVGQQLDDVPTAPKVQKALDALREKGLVWRPGRGSYALEDQDMRDWLLDALAA